MSDNGLAKSYRFSEFEFVRVLGDGGFGITYLGWDHSLDKAVAIKEYFPEDWARRVGEGQIEPLSDRYLDDFNWGKTRFLEEAKTLAKFNHPNLVKAYRYFEANGSGYIVMDYLEGEPLDNVLKREGTLSTKDVRFILERVADGLDSVHQMHFLHRDIKPGNIIISAQDNEPVLIDFGAARQTIRNKTQALTAIVTAGYGPHEQYSIEGDNQGPWTDIYALSALGYNALTGNLPPEGNSRFENDSFVPLDADASDDPALCRAINKGLQVLTRDRPRSAYEWLSVAESELLQASTPDSPKKRNKTRRRSKIVKPKGFAPPINKGSKPSRVETETTGMSSGMMRALMGAATALIIGGLGWSVYQSGQLDSLFDGKMANVEPKVIEKVTAQKKQAEQAQENTKTRAVGQVFRDCEACPEMVVLPAGSFLMGSTPSDYGHQKSEGPQRRVVVPQKFAMGKYEVTVGNWKSCLAGGGCAGYDPATTGTDMSRDDYPVSNIPYLAAKFYVDWINEKTGKAYRLPSEAEWEYAARGGRGTVYPWGNREDKSKASCTDCTKKGLMSVGNFPANDFGLHDVVSGLWEWTADCKTDNYNNAPLTSAASISGDCSERVIRGGSYNDPMQVMRVTNRTTLVSSKPRASGYLGFRLYRDLE